ncbi:hypothetical protein Acr_29g0009120 [Actinidia rufa]|uniref:Retrotransposon gag domain-containing protein n=1 Tax=Actinidia rufa TaxID=165716 RepID=A0A7J0HF38_9ERIC|nr:hypothetical protein Acr_29g0009120 [Actinidia rufa]
MEVPIRATKNRTTTAMKAFLQLRPPIFKGEPDPLVAEDWLEQVTRALDTILVTEKELQVLFASYQLQGDALQWFAKAFVSTEEEKAKQFMRRLKPIRNKIVGNLIKVYSTMVSSTAAIEETLNEFRKIQNPNSQREGTSNQSDGRSSKKPRNFTAQQQQYPYEVQGKLALAGNRRPSRAHDPHSRVAGRDTSIGTITSQGATLLDFSVVRLVILVDNAGKGRTIRELHDRNNLLSQFRPRGSIQHYISTTFISVQTTGCNSAGSEDAGTGLRYDISSGTVRDNWIAGATIGYLCCTRYFTHV